MSEYTMTWGILSKIKKTRGVEELICHSANCDEPIKEGDKVVSKQSKSGRHIYHKSCYVGSFFG